MSQSEIAEKVASNTLLTAVSRVAIVVLVPVTMSIGAWYLSTTSGAISDLNKGYFALADRVTAVEINERNVNNQNGQFQTDTKEALSKVQDQQLAILQTLAAISATLKAQTQQQ